MIVAVSLTSLIDMRVTSLAAAASFVSRDDRELSAPQRSRLHQLSCAFADDDRLVSADRSGDGDGRSASASAVFCAACPLWPITLSTYCPNGADHFSRGGRLWQDNSVR